VYGLISKDLELQIVSFSYDEQDTMLDWLSSSS
jgi:hypothetical protein